MRQIERVEEFIARLPGLVGGRRSLKVLLGTYNEVGEPPREPPPVHRALELTVLEGRAFTQTMMRGYRTSAQYDLAIIYAGKSSFERVLTYARGLKRAHPGTLMVLLTCDCVTSEKSQRDVLLELVASRELEGALVTRRCGANWDMRDLLDAVAASWTGPSN